MQLQARNKVVLVAGGSSGIGAAAAHLFAEAGARVVITYHSGRDRADGILRQLTGSGHAALPLSISDPSSVRQVAESVTALFGQLDVLVNSAGFTQPIPHRDLDALTDEFFDSIMVTNVRGPFALIRALVPLLRRSGGAAIVNVSSIGGATGSGSNIAYCASKGALDTMSLSLARALGPEIRVLTVAPGAVDTQFLPGRDRAALEKLAEVTPLRRVVEPEDVARSIVFAALALTCSTGTRIVVDAGRALV